MTKYLFLLFEGLPDTVIDSQVLIHCKEMKRIGLEFEIWTFACNGALYTKSLNKQQYAQELSQCEVKVFKGVRPAYPFSERINAWLVKKYLKFYNKNFDVVHARTDYSSHIASLVFNNFIWDCRGDTLAEFQNSFKKSNNFFGKMYKKYKIFRNIEQAKKAKKAIFVSSFLKKKYDFLRESHIIGCAADERLFYFDLSLRTKTRNLLKIEANKKVLIYSGSITYYQMFAECVNLFSSLHKDWLFLVLTQDVLLAQEKLNFLDDSRYILKSAKLNEVNAFLNAADVGILLREKDDLNLAASPTKYAEYAMSGLSVVHSDEIGDLDIYDKQIGNRILEDDLNTFQIDFDKRDSIAMNAKILSKENTLILYKYIYGV